MARFVIGTALGDFGSFVDVVNPNALSPVLQNATTDRYEDPEGDGFAAIGTGFTYAGLIPVGGTMTGVDVFTAAGDPLLTITNLAIPLAQFYQTFSLIGLEAAFLFLTSGDDTFIGSANNDYLLAGEGNDTIKGNGGMDFLVGFTGRDVLTGGAGPDHFVFNRGDGRDRITDFSDLGTASDDKIDVTARMYRNMVVTETLTGVELDFGARSIVVVDGWHAVDVGRSDFMLG